MWSVLFDVVASLFRRQCDVSTMRIVFKLFFLIYCCICAFTLSECSDESSTSSPHVNSDTQLIPTIEEGNQSDDQLLLVSTINGAIYIVSESDGHVIWEIPEAEFPVLKLPQQIIRPLFVANPRDGGLYRMGVNPSGSLEKLELGIPEMVRHHF